jgi:uncharacterized protein DUF2490
MIKKKRWQLIYGALLQLLLFPGISYAQSRPTPRTDTQNWNDLLITVPVSSKVDFQLAGTLRIGRNITNPVDERIGVGFSFKVGKYLTLTPAYLYITTQPTATRKAYENRLNFAATVRFPLNKFTITDRNLFERRLRHPGGDSTRYRNRLQVDHPLYFKGLKWAIADEIFYDWSFNAWVRNRFTIGLEKTFNKQVTGAVYYLRQNDSHSVPGDLHVIGTAVRFRL